MTFEPASTRENCQVLLLFNLTTTLGLLSRRNWEKRDDVKLMEQGWKRDTETLFYTHLM